MEKLGRSYRCRFGGRNACEDHQDLPNVELIGVYDQRRKAAKVAPSRSQCFQEGGRVIGP